MMKMKNSKPKKKKFKKATHAQRAMRYATECAMKVRDVPEPIQKAYKKWLKYKKKYNFDEKRFNRICKLIEIMSLPEVEDTNSGKQSLTFKLQDWQCALLSWVFGFYTVEGFRAVNEMHLIIPRKAGKSSIAAGTLLVELMEPTGGGTKPEILILGVNTETTDIVYGKIRSILEGDSRLGGHVQKRYKISQTKTRVRSGLHGGYIEKISAKARSLEGKTARVVFADEISRLESPAPLNVLRTGLGHSRNHLLFTATTPSDLPISAMEPTREKVLRWLDDDKDLGSSVGLLYEAKIDDDFDDPAVWKRVQPSLGKIVTEDYYRSSAKQAEINEEEKRDFETRLLCKPLSGGTVWVTQQDIKDLPMIHRPDPLIHPDVKHFIGCDFSDVSDTTSMCLLSVNVREGWQEARWMIYYPSGNSRYESKAGAEKDFHANKTHLYYSDMAKNNYVKINPGRTLNHRVVARDLWQWTWKYNPNFIVCDDYDVVHEIRNQLPEEMQLKFLKMSKTPVKVSAPAGELARWIKDKTIMFDKNPVVEQHFRNTHVKEMQGGGIRLEKPTASSSYKIDAVDALVNAVAGYLETTELKHIGTEHNPIQNIEATPLSGEEMVVYG